MADPARERLALLLAGGGVRCRRLVAALPTDEDILGVLRRGGAPGPFLSAARRLLDDTVPAVLERVDRAGWRWLTPAAAEYPPLLEHTADPPLGLFVRGRLAGGPPIGIVGARRATAYGIDVGRLLAEGVAAGGATVVSGMARGIDAAAHEGALAGGGTTWAVWGTGPDRVYPPEHGALAERIASSGALLTEYPPGTPPRKHHFPERNRILAGLCDAVVVVEAAARSGALVTARLALDEGREVLAVPGSVLSDLSIGPNSLLRIGARPALLPADLLEAVGLPRDGAGTADRRGGASDDPLLRQLAPGEARTLDELVDVLGGDASATVHRLLELEMDGRVRRELDGRYRRRE